MTDTIVDRGVIEQAVDQTGIELIDEYGETGCFALEAELRNVIEFFMLIAQYDHALGVNLADVMRGDVVIWWFPGFKLEPIPDPDRVESNHILESDLLDPDGDDPFRGSEI